MQSEELRNINSPDTEALWRLVRPSTGAVDEVRATARGNSSDVTALVACESGPVFVKACHNQPGGRRASLIRERLVNPYVRTVSPALRWQAEDDGWIALGFEVVEGRSADFTPGSPDLPAVVDVLNRIGELPLPPEAHDWPETRWNRYAEEADAPLFEGRTLLFTDINPDNVMIGDDRTWAVDWSWPTRGATFIDPACLVIQLIAAGHSANEAESWAAHCTAWSETDGEAIDAFCTASLRMHRTFAERSPEASWIRKMAEAAESWSRHRCVTG
ncbi:phosphotransferase [Streptomyces sp. NPDC057555]|uniref:phosphotransferase n=1 Tax=Streptomyces sp. NPDC057555 TaxID=3346166 RepID=UPI0036792B6D